jgi:hypothetical protein
MIPPTIFLGIKVEQSIKKPKKGERKMTTQKNAQDAKNSTNGNQATTLTALELAIRNAKVAVDSWKKYHDNQQEVIFQEILVAVPEISTDDSVATVVKRGISDLLQNRYNNPEKKEEAVKINFLWNLAGITSGALTVAEMHKESKLLAKKISLEFKDTSAYDLVADVSPESKKEEMKKVYEAIKKIYSNHQMSSDKKTA